jgi:threonine aldolase
VVKKSASGRVPEKIGVISIESPVRRKSGEVFDYKEMKKISIYAREQQIKNIWMVPLFFWHQPIPEFR